MTNNKLSNGDKKKITYMISLITQIGISMMVPIFLCVYIGIFVSKKTGIDILVLLFIFFGFAVAFRNVYHLTKGAYESDKKQEDAYQKYLDDMNLEREQRFKEKVEDKSGGDSNARG